MTRPPIRARPEVSWPPVRIGGLFAAQTILVLGYAWALWALAGVPDEQKSVTISLIYAPIEILSATMLWLASRAASGPTRRGWGLLCAAMTCSALVNVEWVWAAIEPTHVFRWPSFVVVYAQFPFALWAFASFPAASGSDVDRKKYLLDSAIVLVASGVLAWHFVFRELIVARGATGLFALRLIAYTALCLTVLSAALTLFVRRPSRRMATPLVLLTGGWAMWTLANTLQMRATALRGSMNEITFNACFAAGAWLVASAAFAYLTRTGPQQLPNAGAKGDTRAPGYSLLPYAAIASVFGVLLLQAQRAVRHPAPSTTAPLLALVAGAIAITIVVVARQILAQRSNTALVAERLRREAHFSALVQHASDVILVVDADGVVREASPSVAHTLGRAPDTLVGFPLADVAHESDRSLVRADLAQIAASGTDGPPRPSAPCEWRVVRPDDQVRWLEVLCTNLLHDPAVGGIVVNGRDVSERKALEAELTRQAYHDALTGLVNRARFRDIVEQALGSHEGAQPDDRTSVAVLYIDLDGFKPINDTLGHGAGDRVLSVVTERLRDATRGSDVVARLGGDEFGILLEHVRDVDEAAAVARRVLARVQQPIAAERAIVHVGASIGIACTPIGGEGSAEYANTCEALLRDADEAMYAAKAQGGWRYVIYAPRVSRPEGEL